MHRFLIVLALSLLLLVGCGSDTSDPLARNCAIPRSPAEEISLCLPDGWSLATHEFGEQDSFVVYIQTSSNDANQIAMQIHVKKDPLNEPVRSTTAFAERAVELARSTAPNYKVVSTDPLSVNHKETLLHIFDAQPEQAELPVRYYQFVTTHEGYAYGFTAVMNLAENADSSLEETLLDVFTNIRFV